MRMGKGWEIEGKGEGRGREIEGKRMGREVRKVRSRRR